MQKLKFPKGFLWGAATSAHQIEGNNTNSDWWAWEHSQKRAMQLESQGKNPADYYSREACDSYHRFDEDFALAEHLNHNATRLGIEWARIEPKEGHFSEEALDHYEKVLQSAKFHGLKTFVTLHHYTNPLWFAKRGGFEKKANARYFHRYVEKAVKRLDQYTDFWVVLNEPEEMVSLSYWLGIWPPQKKSLITSFLMAKNLKLVFEGSVKVMRQITNKPIGMACNLHDLRSSDLLSSLTVYFRQKFNRFIFEHSVGWCDFIGLNYYFHHHVGLFGNRAHSHSHHSESDLGWGIHPEGLEWVLLSLKKYGKPVYITENGLADAKDHKREKFIKDHLYYMHRAIQKGVDVRGYLHWSLIDNFEWDKGFAPRFGLIEIDREDLLRRKVRYSAIKYAEICKNNYMQIDHY